jgi:hypothetical protein
MRAQEITDLNQILDHLKFRHSKILTLYIININGTQKIVVAVA